MNENYASDYEVRLATLGAMSGDTSVHYDSVYDIDLKILEKVQEGGGGGEPDEYLKNASVSGNTLTLTKKDGSTVEFTPEGGGDKTIIVLTEDRTQDEWKAIYDNITPKIAAKEDLSDYLFVYKNGTHYCEAIDVHYAQDNWLIFTFIKYGFENPQQYFRYDIMSNGECYTDENNVYAVDEAPEDGKTYGRQNACWVEVSGGGGASAIEVTQQEYDEAKEAGTLQENALYIITDAPVFDISDYVTKEKLSEEIEPALEVKADKTNVVAQTSISEFSSFKVPLWNSDGVITGYKELQSGYSQINGSYKGFVTNGSTFNDDIYAPTSVGASGQILYSKGSGAPEWKDGVSTTVSGGVKIVKITEEEFEALETKDANTLYMIVEE